MLTFTISGDARREQRQFRDSVIVIIEPNVGSSDNHMPHYRDRIHSVLGTNSDRTVSPKHRNSSAL